MKYVRGISAVSPTSGRSHAASQLWEGVMISAEDGEALDLPALSLAAGAVAVSLH